MERGIKSSAFVIKVLLVVAAVSFSWLSVEATHLRAGEIVAERVDCNSLTFRIVVTVYTNTGSSVLFGGRVGEEDILDFGDGTWQLVPETENTPRPDLGPNIGTAQFEIYHTFAGPGKYTISYREPNRNEGVLNMDNSVNTRFYIETEIFIDPFIGCNSTPVLNIPPVDQACTGVAFFHNPGATDADGDSLSYELVVPFSDRNLTVIRYQDPNANAPRSFYSNYNIANENGDGPPTFSIDPDGNLTWDAPGIQGEYNIAFIIREWRKIGDEYVPIGFVRRDMQILVNECQNDRPDLELPNDTCVVAGTTLEAVIRGIDPNNDDVKIEAFSDVFNFAQAESPATYSPEPAYAPVPYELNFKWDTKCLHVKEQPYVVVFKITDNPPSGPRLTTFRTWKITVVGPPPVWNDISLIGRNASLEWDSYACANAETIQVWRRVDSLMYTPANCETGMPEFLGYELIDQVPASSTSYLDDNGGLGLAPGANYCYRLVALFPSPKGGESYMSEEVCTGPILADAPIITHVTVDKTSQTEGEITIRWREPFEADPVTYPLPYSYEIYRGEGPVGIPTVPVIPGRTNNLEVTDIGLNTEDLSYHYWVVAYDANSFVIDTSAVASSVRLEAMSQLNRIDLSWSAFVPWSNTSLADPYHLIFRGPEGSTEAELELIDSVNVVVSGFAYGDEGQYNDEPLENDQVYCYRIMTRGAYGNPDIDEPLENYSQIICTQPSDSIPPCEVIGVVAVNPPDCEDYEDVCNKNVFSNEISWERPTTGDCQNDIASYNIYVSASKGGDFVLHATGVRTTSFIDENLPSFARCYKVSAVDRSGNEGPLSEAVCIDNCPQYVLPNVFTPNGDPCNEVFSAYSDREEGGGENGEGTGSLCSEIPDDSRKLCARFVERVHFRVYNRWGKEVYTYQSGSERTIYIDWDGHDNDGRELSSGIYYYIAEVTFTSVDPTKRNQIIKGWVHILR